MNSEKKILAMIPARIGSDRLKFKNLVIINHKPLIYYAINSAKKSKIFDDIIINSDHKIFAQIASRYKIKFYLRNKLLGKANIKSDDVVLDFINNFACDIIVWVNPITPLIGIDEIKSVIKYFIDKNYNSLITTNEYKFHGLLNQDPINFKINKKFDKTQNLKPIKIMNYALMMWKTKSFKKNMIQKGHAILHNKVGFYNTSFLSNFIVKYKEDIFLIEKILNSKKTNHKIKYDKLVKNLI